MIEQRYFESFKSTTTTIRGSGGMRLMRFACLAIVLSFQIALGAKATKGTLDITKLLPGKSDLTGFEPAGEVKSYDRGKVWDYFGPAADRFVYNTVQYLAAAQYVSPDRARKLSLDVMTFADPLKAFAFYSFYRSSGCKFVNLPTEGYITNDTLVFFKGSYFGRVVASYAGSEADLQAAAVVVTSRIPDTLLLPTQLAIFPEEGLIPHSKAVSLDDIDGHNDRSNLFSAKYHIDSATTTLCFRLNAGDAAMVTASNEFFEGQKTIDEYVLDAGYQSFLGTNKQKEKVLCAFNKGVLCAVIGFNDRKTAQHLVAQIFDKAIPK